MDNDPNPPQSLAEIIQQRMAAEATQALAEQRTRDLYRLALRRGVVAGLLFSGLVGMILVIKSLL